MASFASVMGGYTPYGFPQNYENRPPLSSIDAQKFALEQQKAALAALDTSGIRPQADAQLGKMISGESAPFGAPQQAAYLSGAGSQAAAAEKGALARAQRMGALSGAPSGYQYSVAQQAGAQRAQMNQEAMRRWLEMAQPANYAAQASAVQSAESMMTPYRLAEANLRSQIQYVPTDQGQTAGQGMGQGQFGSGGDASGMGGAGFYMEDPNTGQLTQPWRTNPAAWNKFQRGVPF